MNDNKRLRPEMVFVILWDPDKGTMYLQRKDDTYWVPDYRLKYCFIGTGVVSERAEKPLSALKRKLEVEMPDARQMITDEMRLWKSFDLRWDKSVIEAGCVADEGYACHVFVRMMTNRYEMMRVEDAIRSRGRKRATSMPPMTIDDVKKIKHEEFLGSLYIVVEEFLEGIENPVLFWDKMKRI